MQMEDPKRVEEGLGYGSIGNKDRNNNHNNNENENIYEDRKEESTENDRQERRVAPEEPVQVTKDDEQPPATIVKPKNKRIATLDAFRGLAIVVNIIIYYVVCMHA